MTDEQVYLQHICECSVCSHYRDEQLPPRPFEVLYSFDINYEARRRVKDGDIERGEEYAFIKGFECAMDLLR